MNFIAISALSNPSINPWDPCLLTHSIMTSLPGTDDLDNLFVGMDLEKCNTIFNTVIDLNVLWIHNSEFWCGHQFISNIEATQFKKK